MVIRGHQIGLDQATDYAWVNGNGSLTQMAARGFFSDKGLESQKSQSSEAGKKEKNNKGKEPKGKGQEKETKPAPTSPMTIVFAGLPSNGKGMEFFGRSTDPKGQTVATAEFYRDVHAETDESTLDCQEVMRTFFDKPIKLAQVKAAPAKPATTTTTTADSVAESDPATPPPPPEPKPELAMIVAVKNVVVVNTKRDPGRPNAVIQRQRIEGDSLIYDKLTARKFRVPSEGVV